MWPFVIIGVVTGGVYGLAGVGLVLTYKTSGLFNFAHGSIATASAYCFYTLTVLNGMHWSLSAALAILIVAPFSTLLFEMLARKIVRDALAVQVAATVGVLLIVQATVILTYGVTATRIVPPFLPQGQFELGGVFVNYSDVLTFAIALLATAALYAFLRFSRTGTAMRGVVDDPDLLELSGTSAMRVRRSAWFIGSTFAAASGVLIAPLLPLDPTLLTLLVVQAFGAAALGAFRSLPLTFLGGIAIGVLAALATKWFSVGALAGVPPAVPFLVLFLALLVLPRKYLADHSRRLPPSTSGWSTPWQVQAAMGVVVLGLLVAVPGFAGIHLTDWTTGVGTIIIFLSLGLLVRTSGQVSLGHVAFAAIGVTSFAHFSDGLPWLVALGAAGLVAVPVGALLALPAMRLPGLYLAIATFGFGLALNYVFYTQPFMFGNAGAGLAVPRPGIERLSTDVGYYYVVLAFAVAASVAVMWLTRSRLGRLLRAMADSPLALTAAGTSVNVTRLIVFCISAFLASIGGALVGAGQSFVSANSYPPLLSLTYLVLVVIVGGHAPWYAVIAGLSLIVVPSYASGYETTYWLQILFGVSALAFALTPVDKRGLSPAFRDRLDRMFRHGSSERSHPRVEALATSRGPMTATVSELSVRDVSVHYGGIVAADNVTVTAPTGQITGLIGPNGAGKTTLFNACSGLVPPSSGQVLLHGRRIDRRRADARARAGLGRTFQRSELYGSLTVLENVAMGYEGARAGASPLTQVLATPRQRRNANQAAWEAIDLCGIRHLAGVPARQLSTGQRRLVELARCLAGPFDVLLLDEASSGLDRTETHRFGDVLIRAVQERGIGILLVEHDMELVMRLCDRIFVLDFGRIIFEGAPSEVRSSDVVRDAYLGERHTTQPESSESSEMEPVL